MPIVRIKEKLKLYIECLIILHHNMASPVSLYLQIKKISWDPISIKIFCYVLVHAFTKDERE